MSPTNSGGSPGYASSPGYSTSSHHHHMTSHHHQHQYAALGSSQPELYATHLNGGSNNGSPPQLYASQSGSHQVYHPTPASPSHQMYGSLMNPNIGYSTSTWHSGPTGAVPAGGDYGAVYPNSYHYQSGSEFIPIIGELR